MKDFLVNPEPVIITQNGEAKMSVVEQHALLSLIALGHKEYKAGNFTEADAFFAEMDKEELA